MNYKMSDEIDDEVPVLIVGAGPAGLTCAIALARAGVECLLVERRDELSSLPRATYLSLGSMELMRSFGLEGALRARANDVEFVAWSCETLAAVGGGSPMPVGIPTRAESALISPTAPACVPQDQLEPLLLEHVRGLGPARVALGTELADVRASADGVEATLRDGAGEPHTIRARYLVAADGAYSRIRAQLGIRMLHEQRLHDSVSVLFRASLWGLLDEHRYGLYSIEHPGAPGIFLPAGRDDRWIYGATVDAHGGPEALTEARLMAAVRTGAGVPRLEVDVERTGVFSFAAGLAETFRRDSAFLVGDAAHRVTPRGGTGMNMAIRGGFDLGWKLGWVLRGWAPDALLDTYERDRLPAVRHNIRRSLDPAGTMRETDGEFRVDLGPRIRHLWSSAGGERRTSTLDLVSPGLTLIAGPEGAPEHRWAAERVGPPVSVRRVDALAAWGLGLQDGAALLVRPDATLAAWLAPGEPAQGRNHGSVCEQATLR